MFEKVLLSAYGKFPMIPFSRKKVLDVLYGNSLSSFLGHFVVTPFATQLSEKSRKNRLPNRLLGVLRK